MRAKRLEKRRAEKFGKNSRLNKLTSKVQQLKSEKIRLSAQLQAELRRQETAEEKMQTLTEKMAEHLQCSVCLLVPKDMRIPVCVNGHITCVPCKEEIGGFRCPECREANSEERFSVVAGNISDLLGKTSIKENYIFSDISAKFYPPHSHPSGEHVYKIKGFFQLFWYASEWS